MIVDAGVVCVLAALDAAGTPSTFHDHFDVGHLLKKYTVPMRTVRVVTIVCLGLLVAAVATVVAQRSATPSASTTAASEATARIVASTKALLATLDDAGKAKVQVPFDGPSKSRWSNLAAFKRAGLRMGDLTPAQRAAVNELLSTAFSREGYQKVSDIMHADQLFAVTQGIPTARGTYFGEKEYYLAFVGTPSTTAPWMLQLGGHHLAINLTMAGGQASMAPSLPGAQPAKFTVEGRMARPFGKENDIGFALINALNDTERRQAILNYEIKDLVLGTGQDGKRIQPEGLKASAMSASQQAMLVDLAKQWSGIMNDAFAEVRMAEIRANLPETYFAWSGPTTDGSPAYFRIQGPTLLIEYAPQENSVDHLHTMYRDPTNDYGAKFAGQ